MYTKGEVVWAKIKGFPWWPGIVAKVIEDRDDPNGISEILVNFIGENSHAQLSSDKVAKFQQKYNEYAKMKKKKLLESIEAANRIIRGESTFKMESVRAENKEIVPKIPKRKKDTKSTTKSSHNKDNESHSESESENSSDNGSNSPPALTKSKSTQKPTETKQLKRQNSTPKLTNPGNNGKNTGSNKNSKTSVGNKRELEDTKNSGEPKLVKMLKGNDASEHVSSPDSKNLEELNGKFERHISCPPLIPNSNGILIQNGKINLSDITLDNKEFDAIRDLLVEKIMSHNKSHSVSGTILEKSIENVLSKINPETVPISDIVDKELGKNIYTLIVLIDQLTSTVPKNGMNIETELGIIKNKLVNCNDILKKRLVSHYIENNDACTPWLKKIDQVPAQKEPPKNNKLEKLQHQLSELTENSKIEEEPTEDKAAAAPAPALQMNFEEFRYETDKKKVLGDKNSKMVTTSTKVTKPIYNTSADMKKADTKQKENVVNPNLRKKICLKMSKVFQEKYGLAKDAAQAMTLKVETRIRNSSPDMGNDYKDKILVVLKLLKYSMRDIEQYANDHTVDFFNLREKLDVYQQQNPDLQLEVPFGDDSPSSTKEISREVSIINGKMC